MQPVAVELQIVKFGTFFTVVSCSYNSFVLHLGF